MPTRRARVLVLQCRSFSFLPVTVTLRFYGSQFSYVLSLEMSAANSRVHCCQKLVQLVLEYADVGNEWCQFSSILSLKMRAVSSRVCCRQKWVELFLEYADVRNEWSQFSRKYVDADVKKTTENFLKAPRSWQSKDIPLLRTTIELRYPKMENTPNRTGSFHSSRRSEHKSL